MLATRVRMVGLAALAAVGGVACSSSSATPTPSAQVVGLGDSFTSNSFHSPSVKSNGCTQSAGNQPHVVASRLGKTLSDMSCDGATTNDILNPGKGDTAQIDAVTASAEVVTLSIGGNDIGFSGIVTNCTLDYVTFGGCSDEYLHDGIDEISQSIAATAPKVAQVLQAVHTRAPSAKVFVYGYPTLVPMTGTSGCTGLTLAAADIPYLRAKQAELNQMLATQAAANGATYIDVYTPSAGHDPCSSSKWVARTIDLPPAHPSKAGMDAIANIVATAIDAQV